MSLLKSTPLPVVTVVTYIPGVHVCSSSWSPMLLLMALSQFILKTNTLRLTGFPLHVITNQHSKSKTENIAGKHYMISRHVMEPLRK